MREDVAVMMVCVQCLMNKRSGRDIARNRERGGVM
jgi:hypothetical protein